MTIVFCKKDLLFCASGDAFAFFLEMPPRSPPPPQPVPPFVPRRAGGAEGGDRPLAALCELGRLRLPAQPVCKVPVGALLVAAGEGGEECLEGGGDICAARLKV